MSGYSLNVYQRLNLAREEFHHAQLKKSGHNKFAGYFYFELADFVVPALSIFKKFGLTPLITFKNDMAEMKIINSEKPEEMIIINSPMSEANLKGCHPVQNLGAVQSYLRRYLWVAALEIVEHDALDATTGKGSGRIKPTDTEITLPQEEVDYLREMAQELTELAKNGDAKAALLMVQAAGLEAEQHTFLWSQLDSTTRSAIKKAKEQ
jgi:hypothetical protein